MSTLPFNPSTGQFPLIGASDSNKVGGIFQTLGANLGPAGGVVSVVGDVIGKIGAKKRRVKAKQAQAKVFANIRQTLFNQVKPLIGEKLGRKFIQSELEALLPKAVINPPQAVDITNDVRNLGNALNQVMAKFGVRATVDGTSLVNLNPESGVAGVTGVADFLPALGKILPGEVSVQIPKGPPASEPPAAKKGGGQLTLLVFGLVGAFLLFRRGGRR